MRVLFPTTLEHLSDDCAAPRWFGKAGMLRSDSLLAGSARVNLSNQEGTMSSFNQGVRAIRRALPVSRIHREESSLQKRVMIQDTIVIAISHARRKVLRSILTPSWKKSTTLRAKCCISVTSSACVYLTVAIQKIIL